MFVSKLPPKPDFDNDRGSRSRLGGSPYIRSRPDGQHDLQLVVTAAMASGPPAFVNRMVRRWISRQVFGNEHFSASAE
jgi:hypothetical protein